MSKLNHNSLKIGIDQVRDSSDQMIFPISATEDLKKRLVEIGSEIAVKMRGKKRDVIVVVGIRD